MRLSLEAASVSPSRGLPSTLTGDTQKSPLEFFGATHTAVQADVGKAGPLGGDFLSLPHSGGTLQGVSSPTLQDGAQMLSAGSCVSCGFGSGQSASARLLPSLAMEKP